MLNQMELLQEHMMENAGKPKGTSGVLRVEECSSSCYSKPGENQGWNSKRYEECFHPRYLQRDGNQGWNYHKGEEQRRYYKDWDNQSDYWRRAHDHEEDYTHSSESLKLKGNASSPRNNKVNSHADAIKILEGQLSLLSAQLKPKMTTEDDERGLVVVTRSGKVTIGDVTTNEGAKTHE
ncbi:hypothetical protein KY289_013270 [Solanum tuberosum]|nr:hypothetical protein KY289_013270 [Solanum tuberosum]